MHTESPSSTPPAAASAEAPRLSYRRRQRPSAPHSPADRSAATRNGDKTATRHHWQKARRRNGDNTHAYLMKLSHPGSAASAASSAARLFSPNPQTRAFYDTKLGAPLISLLLPSHLLRRPEDGVPANPAQPTLSSLPLPSGSIDDNMLVLLRTRLQLPLARDIVIHRNVVFFFVVAGQTLRPSSSA